jgi:hypothetical protein
MKYLVMVSDLVARQVYVDADSKEEALENANYGKWRLPEDVEHEEVVDRQAVEILEEEEVYIETLNGSEIREEKTINRKEKANEQNVEGLGKQ